MLSFRLRIFISIEVVLFINVIYFFLYNGDTCFEATMLNFYNLFIILYIRI